MVARGLALAAGLAALLGALVYADVARRAYVACRAGERYLEWHEHPERQVAHWDAWLESRRAAFDAAVAKGAMEASERDWRLKLAKAERDERVAENPLKYAVRWFETTVDLFSLPPSPWAARAKAELGPAREQFRRELAAAGLDVSEYPSR